MSDKPSTANYDSIRCPGIGEAVSCAPESVVFESGSAKFRLTLAGKTGRAGYVEEPRFVLEVSQGADALGVEAWVKAAPTHVAMLGALFMEMRRQHAETRFEAEKLNAEHRALKTSLTHHVPG